MINYTSAMQLPYPDYDEIADVPLQGTALGIRVDTVIGQAWTQWTPRVWGLGLRQIDPLQYMRYKKVGKRVTIRAKIVVTNSAGGSSVDCFMELPFVPEGTYWASGSIPPAEGQGIVPLGSVHSANASLTTFLWQPVVFPWYFGSGGTPGGGGYTNVYAMQMKRIGVAWSSNDLAWVAVEYDAVA